MRVALMTCPGEGIPTYHNIQVSVTLVTANADLHEIRRGLLCIEAAIAVGKILARLATDASCQMEMAQKRV